MSKLKMFFLLFVLLSPAFAFADCADGKYKDCRCTLLAATLAGGKDAENVPDVKVWYCCDKGCGGMGYDGDPRCCSTGTTWDSATKTCKAACVWSKANGNFPCLEADKDYTTCTCKPGGGSGTLRWERISTFVYCRDGFAATDMMGGLRLYSPPVGQTCPATYTDTTYNDCNAEGKLGFCEDMQGPYYGNLPQNGVQWAANEKNCCASSIGLVNTYGCGVIYRCTRNGQQPLQTI